MEDKLNQTATLIEQYIEEHLFDPAGIMYAYVDVRTGQPFDRAAITTRQTPVRAHFDPWSYWTYEDSIQTTGVYLDGLVRQYEVTRVPVCLERAHKTLARHSQHLRLLASLGHRKFLRPYGGYLTMRAFAEPLGTDQASTLCSGLYRYSQHADTETRTQIADVMVKTLSWYEQQDFAYFYYKAFIHSWNADFQHAASYYLPAIAWAAKATGEKKWRDLLTAKLALFQDPALPNLPVGPRFILLGQRPADAEELLGEEFEITFPAPDARRCLPALPSRISNDTTHPA